MVCPTCGAQNAPGVAFCANCGQSLEASPSNTQPQQQSQPQNQSNNLSNLAIVFGAISCLFLPIAFGPAAIILAAVAKSKGERRANTAFTISIIGMVVGLIFGAIVAYNKLQN